jgi:hypothetical protein
MGTITMSVTETGQTTATKTFNIADADVDRVVASYQAEANYYYTNGGNPVVATRAQVLLYIANWLANSIATHVYNTEHATALAAVVTVPPVLT